MAYPSLFPPRLDPPWSDSELHAAHEPTLRVVLPCMRGDWYTLTYVASLCLEHEGAPRASKLSQMPSLHTLFQAANENRIPRALKPDWN